MERNPLDKTLELAWKNGISVQSAFFRKHPKVLGMAASLGLITTLDVDGTAGGVWRLTPKGVIELFKIIERHEDELRTNVISPNSNSKSTSYQMDFRANCDSHPAIAGLTDEKLSLPSVQTDCY
jgi:hypothetical protein